MTLIIIIVVVAVAVALIACLIPYVYFKL